MTEIKEYLERKEKNYETLSSYIMSEDKDDKTFKSLLDIFEHQNDKDEFEEFLTTLSYISRNYYRYPVFLSKIKQILSRLSEKIKQFFLNCISLRLMTLEKLKKQFPNIYIYT